MKFELKSETYSIRNLQDINTPALFVFGQKLNKNLNEIHNYLSTITKNNPFNHLCPHAKTNKSAYITQLMMSHGIQSFKSTPNETDMLIKAGAKEIFVAYPLMDHNAKRMVMHICKNPDINFLVQIGDIEHAKILKDAGKDKNIIWKYFLDVDIGMHRTGMNPNQALQLYQSLKNWQGFEFSGIHGYDGHNHFQDAAQRKKTAEKAMKILTGLVRQFENQGIKIERVMAAGSPSFKEDFKILYHDIGDAVHVQVSPGTWIYWDSEYDQLIPGMFQFAAIIVAQVIDKNGDLITINAGHKRWAADQGPVQIFSVPGLEVSNYSEEHTVLKNAGNENMNIGDYILIVPRHVCPTVNLYESFYLVGADGNILPDKIPVDARNR